MTPPATTTGSTGTGSTATGSTATRLRLAVTRLARRLRQHAGNDEVTATQQATLASLDRLGPLTLGELAHVEHVQPPTMTRVVARLEELGLAVREVDERDRRVARARLTEQGAAFLVASRSRRDAYLADRLGRLTPDERATVEAALPLLERLLDAEDRT